MTIKFTAYLLKISLGLISFSLTKKLVLLDKVLIPLYLDKLPIILSVNASLNLFLFSGSVIFLKGYTKIVFKEEISEVDFDLFTWVIYKKLTTAITRKEAAIAKMGLLDFCVLSFLFCDGSRRIS